MNKINFLNEPSFPLSSNMLSFMQDVSNDLSYFTAFGGSKDENYILYGCEMVGSNTVRDGYVVINGELLPFIGGVVNDNSTIFIREVTEDITVLDHTYESIRVKREARIGDATTSYPWSSFKRLTNLITMKAIIDELRQTSAPVGTVSPYAGRTAPTGWLFCNGLEYTSAQYPDLCAVITGNSNAASFFVPDLRGRFIVGAGDTVTGLNTGDNYYTYSLNQKGGWNTHKLSISEMPKHEHSKSIGQDCRGTKGTAKLWSNFNDSKFTASLGVAGGDGRHENRPPFYALNYIIKF